MITVWSGVNFPIVSLLPKNTSPRECSFDNNMVENLLPNIPTAAESLHTANNKIVELKELAVRNGRHLKKMVYLGFSHRGLLWGKIEEWEPMVCETIHDGKLFI